MDCCLRTEGIRRLLSILMQARLSLLIGDPPLDIVFYFEGISFHDICLKSYPVHYEVNKLDLTMHLAVNEVHNNLFYKFVITFWQLSLLAFGSLEIEIYRCFSFIEWYSLLLLLLWQHMFHKNYWHIKKNTHWLNQITPCLLCSILGLVLAVILISYVS